MRDSTTTPIPAAAKINPRRTISGAIPRDSPTMSER
jgi:hypothetical protein